MKPKKEEVSFRGRFSISDWRLLNDIKETVTLSVSARGNGLAIYLPKDLCDVYGLIAGDRIKISLRDHFRKMKVPS